MITRARTSATEGKWAALRTAALSFPGAWEDFPWGEVVVKVQKKVFVFLGTPGADRPAITVKLTVSLDHARSTAGASPAGYGLGKAGWVTVPIAPLKADLLTDWIEEIYRNVAPKRLAAELNRP
jgi:predicted DNA-binding protein (MmcQ/YjbR family)